MKQFSPARTVAIVVTTIIFAFMLVECSPANANYTYGVNTKYTSFNTQQEDPMVWNMYTHDLNELRVQEWLRGLGYLAYEITIRGDRGQLTTYNHCFPYTAGLCRQDAYPTNINPANVVGVSLITQQRQIHWLANRTSDFGSIWTVDPNFAEAIHNVSWNQNYTGYRIRHVKEDVVYNPLSRLDDKPITHAPTYGGNVAAKASNTCTCQQQQTKKGTVQRTDPVSKKPYVVDFEIPVVSENRYY